MNYAALMSDADIARFMTKFTPGADDECWPWHGTIASTGYGVFSIRGQNRQAYKLSYELNVGPVPDGLVPDHLCRNRPCVNWHHLEPVTHRENLLRGETKAAANVLKTHCPHGHEYSASNTIISKKGTRACRICKNAINLAYMKRYGHPERHRLRPDEVDDGPAHIERLNAAMRERFE